MMRNMCVAYVRHGMETFFGLINSSREGSILYFFVVILGVCWIFILRFKKLCLVLVIK